MATLGEKHAAIRSMYDCLRELTDSGLVDLDEIRAGGNARLADAVADALTLGAEVLQERPRT